MKIYFASNQKGIMIISKIVNLNLETIAKELRMEGKSHQDIANRLSIEANQTIDKSAVTRYFKSNEEIKAQAIEKSDKLKTKLVEAEISTIEGRLTVIERLIEVFETCEGIHDIQVISREIKEHYDSLDKCRGKWATVGINIDNSKTENAVNVVLHLPRKDPNPCRI
jgi:predicted transcriptional regulator